jgi:fatty-acyl-CoA synthase
VDREFIPVLRLALTQCVNQPTVIEINDTEGAERRDAGRPGLRSLLLEGDPAHSWQLPADEWDAIALNYTSGTTGNPRGVVYQHRRRHLLAIGQTCSRPP